MALKIVNIKLSTEYNWESIKNQADWKSVRNSNADWHQPLQTTLVGKDIKIEVEISENRWSSIKGNHQTWQQIRDKFLSWLNVKNY